MFENVLVGVDGRPTGRDAITLASQLRHEGGKLTLAHVHRAELVSSAPCRRQSIAKHADRTPGVRARVEPSTASDLLLAHALTDRRTDLFRMSTNVQGRKMGP